MSEGASASLRELRTPRAAGITGILFAGLFAAAVTLERIAAPGNPTSEHDEFSGVDPALILVASHLVAAGIFFLCAFDTSYFFGYVFAAKAAGAFMAVFMHNAVSTLAAG
jgi:hypothetical protein